MINSGQNATPEDRASLAKILQGFQQNNTNNWFFNAIKNAQPINDGLPHATQRTDALNKKSDLYTIKLIGSSLLGYPQTGIFNSPNPRSQEDIKASLMSKKVKGLLG